MASFQCEKCWFVNLQGRLPDPRSPVDVRLCQYVRRANLDAMWSKEPGTVATNGVQMRKARKLQAELGLESPNYPPLGPWPLDDTVGMTTCVTMLRASVKPGAYNESHQEFQTIRKLRTTYTNVWRICEESESLNLVFTGEKGTKYRTTYGETDSFFFNLFTAGLEKRMDKEVRSDLGLEFSLALKILRQVEEELGVSTTSPTRRRALIMFGGYLVIGYAGSLRGNEGFYVEGRSLIRDLFVGKKHEDRPHVKVQLFGKFKGETNEATSTLIFANESRNGLKIREWVERLAGVLYVEGALGRKGTYIPAICDKKGRVLGYNIINKEFKEQLVKLQEKGVAGLPADLDVKKRFSINRSLRRGSRTRAQAMRVDKDIVDLINRWSRYDTKGGRPKLTMYDHYAEMTQLLDIYTIYSASL